MLKQLRKEIKKYSSPSRAKTNAWFFKTGPGQYGFGDQFIGLTVPDSRVIAKKFYNLSFLDTKKLLQSKIHEERLIALLILVQRFTKGENSERGKIYNFYLKHTKLVNNWDLVDLSAPKIVGEYLLDKPRAILYKLAKSENLWEKRIAIVGTYGLIIKNEFKDTLKISQILLKDRHDLIHKAVGWMLREVGKRDIKTELKFLDKHYRAMPRTALRYSIERLPNKLKKHYMKK